MKNSFLILLVFSCIASQAQDILGAQILIEKGVKLHDNGLYDEAIMQYDSALVIDPQNVAAMGEKAMSLLAFNKPQEAADLCASIMQDYKGARNIEFVYTTYGNALDELGKPEESLKIYDKGLAAFPENTQLHFNKGITLSRLNRLEEAKIYFENAVLLNPYHVGSHNALARILENNGNDAMALMAFIRFMIIEPETKRSFDNLPLIEKLIKANVETKGKKKKKVITINLAPLEVTDEDNGETQENDFRMVELMLSMSAAMDFEKKNKRQTRPERFQRIMTTFCSGLSETKRDNYGLYWEYYAPYFVALHEANLLEPLSYIVYASSREKSVLKWIKANRSRIDDFYNWDKTFEWN
jgi:tetratricopeptide (TPR) repeat protein